MMGASRIYLDHNATAPLCAAAREAMLAAMDEGGNASSVHTGGRKARARIEAARGHVAALSGAAAGDVTFTSGGTEANNLIIHSALPRAGALVVSSVEHPSVLEAARASGREVRLISCDSDGLVRPDALEAVLEAEAEAPALVSVMLANNETGVIQPIAELANIAHARGALFHTDAVQAAGRLPLDMAALGADYLTLSAHKLGGPQGVGAVVTACGAPLAPMLSGGGQERKARAGTENLTGIAGFGAAARQALHSLEDMSHIKGLRDELERQIQALDNQITILGAGAPRLANTALVARPGYWAETIVIALDLGGIAVSAGAACSSGKTGASHVPAAMGLDDETARSCFRVSLGPNNSPEDVENFVHTLATVLQRMKNNRDGKLAA